MYTNSDMYNNHIYLIRLSSCAIRWYSLINGKGTEFVYK